MFDRFSIVKIASCSLLLTASLFVSYRAINISPATAKETAPQIELPKSNLFSLNQSRKKRPRIAVLDFEFSSIGSEWSPLLKTNIRSVSDILVNKLVDGGHFAVIERNRIDQVMQEQNLGKTGRIEANTAAKLGRVLGVQTILLGSVTSFTLDKQSNGVSVPFFGSIGNGKTTANVKINLRAIDTKTGEILFATEGKGSSDRGDSAIAIQGFSMGSGSSNQGEKLLSEATADAIEQIATKINANPSKVLDI